MRRCGWGNGVYSWLGAGLDWTGLDWTGLDWIRGLRSIGGVRRVLLGYSECVLRRLAGEGVGGEVGKGMYGYR